MSATRKHRVFISYRHAESAIDDSVNDAHRAWVSTLTKNLKARGIVPIWDPDIREKLSKHSTIDPFELPLCKEIARTFPAICNAFVPIITPAYLERLGVVDGKRYNRSDYGVVFEEWQGGGFMAQKGYIDMILVIKSGRAHEFNVGKLTAYFVSQGGVIDFRKDEKEQYERELNKLEANIRKGDAERNPFSQANVQIWCDVYVEWCRAKYSDRFGVPADVWYFNTGAANEFLGDVSSYLRENASTIDDFNNHLLQWKEALSNSAKSANHRLKYSDLTQFINLAIIGLTPNFGLRHLEKTVEFGELALQTIDLVGDSLDRARTQNNIGAGWLELAGKEGDEEKKLKKAADFFRAGLIDLSLEKHPSEWLKLSSNLASALKRLGEIERNEDRLTEANLLNEMIASHKPRLDGQSGN